MNADTTYNGWANYETWCVGMYLDGNYTGEGTYSYVVELVESELRQDHPTSEYWTVEESRRYAVADLLQEFVKAHLFDDDGNTYTPRLHPLVSDLFGAALSSVDWYELADAWIENVREQVTS